MANPAFRHDSNASSGAESSRSDDTIRGHGSKQTPPTSAPQMDPASYWDEEQLSPTSEFPPGHGQPTRSDVAPWEIDDPEPLAADQSQTARSNQNGSSKLPKIGLGKGLSNPFGGASSNMDSYNPIPSYFNSMSAENDPDRRPSVASNSTVSSQGSKGSRVKKFQGMLGDDLPANDGADGSKQGSPSLSRPRSPGPTNEVTPWLYQSQQEAQQFGEAPVHNRMNEKERTPQRLLHSKSNSRFNLSRHRTNKSSEEAAPSSAERQLSRVSSNSKVETLSNGSQTPSGSGVLPNSLASSVRGSVSPPKPSAPMENSELSSSNSKTDQSPGGKRSLMSKILHGRNKNERNESSRSQNSAAIGSELRESVSKHSTTSKHSNTSQQSTPQSNKKEHHNPLKSLRSRRGPSNDTNNAMDPNQANIGTNANGKLWALDTDLTNLEGIVSKDDAGGSAVQANAGQDDPDAKDSNAEPAAGAWDAPDSWAVKRTQIEDAKRLHELDDMGEPLEEDEAGVPHCIRIFRPDQTFTTLQMPLNTTALEIVQNLGRKILSHNDLMNFHIILRKHGTSRQLEPGERPIAIQKKMLEQVGYEPIDRIDELGLEDHSYLCRFTFTPGKMIGYSSLEKDPGFDRLHKFSTIDLSGRNLITIPIALYKKASEIVFLNLSRNLSLDVPKDFISGCTSLREVRFTGNEALRIPPSFILASKLTVLDVSNNSLHQLDDSNLSQLESLASLKLANNRLRSIPSYFSHFKSLRSLNLSSNFLTELPQSVCQIKTLVELDISFNSIGKLQYIGGLEHLERFWATNNLLVLRKEEALKKLKHLREVDVRFNAIEDISVLTVLPQLEHLMAGHNKIVAFEGAFTKIRNLYLDHNPLTRFSFTSVMPTLQTLSLASAKLADLSDTIFTNIPAAQKIILNKNHFASLSHQIGKLSKLDHLSVAKNSLSTLPVEIGRLTELRYLDVRENNINQLPAEIWLCRKLETFNVSSNVLDSFPKAPTNAAMAGLDSSAASIHSINSQSSTINGNPDADPNSEEADTLGEIGLSTRRPSQASTFYPTPSTSPASSHRKGSVTSIYSNSPRKGSVLPRNPGDPGSRKDSMAFNRMTATFAGSLRYLSLADNRLSDEVFDQLTLITELRTLNLSYNELYDIPPRTIRRWTNLVELYLSGNDLVSLPAEDFEECTSLKVLHINNNKFQVLPAELGRIQKLIVLDASSNSLKYNVSNWPYDWNWNKNPSLKYLNLSGNKRLEIKSQQSQSHPSRNDQEDLTNFNNLPNLRVLGLMDVTLMVQSVPDQSENRRVRTSGSSIGSMQYGIADCLGRNDNLSTIDLIVPRLDGHDNESLIGLFDGVAQTTSGSKIAKFLQENFEQAFKDEMRRKIEDETPLDVLRRTYLALNKELAIRAMVQTEGKDRRGVQASRGSVASNLLTQEDLNSGCVATVFYLHDTDLYVSNVGDAQALIVQSEGGYRKITKKHDPGDPKARKRIRDAGGYVSKQGKLNDVVEVSRAFGFTQYIPSIIAAPHTAKVPIQDSDEMVILASRELWDYLTFDYAVDLARSERNDLMRAAQKLRDLAIAFGASSKITVMIMGISDLRNANRRARWRSHSMSMGPSGLPDEYGLTKRGKRARDATLDSKLSRLDQEVEPPTGDVTLVFTDIKNSTVLWETFPDSMRAAIKMHNEVMRRQLRLIGGYEVKTEGDSFMVAFPTVTSALLWSFTCQSQLLEVPWPNDILGSVHGQEINDDDGNCLFRGLSVRMGVHYGTPVCELDPVTRRMDYFGPMVNRAARIEAVADGGQITVSADFISEVQRLLETHIETDRSNSQGSEDGMNDDIQNQNIKRELRSLSSHGFEVKDLGEKRLKGLEVPEYIYLMYPHSLAGRLNVQQAQLEAERAAAERASTRKDSKLTVELDDIWDLWAVSLRLEMLCSSLEVPETEELKPPETHLLEKTKERGDEVTDSFLVNLVEHQVSRIETCINSLALRNLVRPFSQGMLTQACPMMEIFKELTSQLDELKELKESLDMEMADS